LYRNDVVKQNHPPPHHTGHFSNALLLATFFHACLLANFADIGGAWSHQIPVLPLPTRIHALITVSTPLSDYLLPPRTPASRVVDLVSSLITTMSSSFDCRPVCFTYLTWVPSATQPSQPCVCEPAFDAVLHSCYAPPSLWPHAAITTPATIVGCSTTPRGPVALPSRGCPTHLASQLLPPCPGTSTCHHHWHCRASLHARLPTIQWPPRRNP
jgi:hypothetical protein